LRSKDGSHASTGEQANVHRAALELAGLNTLEGTEQRCSCVELTKQEAEPVGGKFDVQLTSKSGSVSDTLTSISLDPGRLVDERRRSVSDAMSRARSRLT